VDSDQGMSERFVKELEDIHAYAIEKGITTKKLAINYGKNKQD
jgi:hypothetical protein